MEECPGSVDPSTYNYSGFCQNDNGRLVAYGADERVDRACPGRNNASTPTKATPTPARRSTSSTAARLVPNRSPCWLAYLPPTPDVGRATTPCRCAGSAKPAARHRPRFEDATLPALRAPTSLTRTTSRRTSVPYPASGPRTLTGPHATTSAGRESLLAVDEGVGAMLDAVRPSGELDNTLFVFTSDNGYFQDEHRVTKGKLKDL